MVWMFERFVRTDSKREGIEEEEEGDDVTTF